MKKYKYSKNVKMKMRKRKVSAKTILKNVFTEMLKMLLCLFAVALFFIFLWFCWGEECKFQDQRLRDFREMQMQIESGF